MKNLLALISIFVCFACSNDDDDIKDYTQENEVEIKQYIENKNLTANKSTSGLYYTIDKEGTGEHPTTNNFVKINYTSSFTNDKVINSSDNSPIYLNLQNALPGLTDGIPKFKKGGSGKIILPSRLAYGNLNSPSIPAGSVIVFDIELLGIYNDINEANNDEITEYLSVNNLTNTAIKTNSGLYYIIEEQGTGEFPVSTDNVTVAYKGYFTNNNIFDESTAGISFNLQQVIKGWTEGITYFKPGGKGKLLIPSSLGYGNYGTNGIPGGSVLIFDINLKSIN